MLRHQPSTLLDRPLWAWIRLSTTFTVASNEFIGGGREKAEYHRVVTWDRLAEIAGTYLGKGQQAPSRAASRPDIVG